MYEVTEDAAVVAAVDEKAVCVAAVLLKETLIKSENCVCYSPCG
jgi:hypothetical protein